MFNKMENTEVSIDHLHGEQKIEESLELEQIIQNNKNFDD
jgi:hypothetical protein